MSARYSSLRELVQDLGGKKPVSRLLVANNGLAAVKGITSIREWLHVHTNSESDIQMVVMASTDDQDVNAEFIRLANHHVDVPGGSNANNYANVPLIMKTAKAANCDAIYPGWGHASENPDLPKQCLESGTITFLGPSEKAMFALGDKIASTIIAQSNDVPTVAWSGDSIRLPQGSFDIPESEYRRAYVETADECEAVCQRIGFPIMIKASAGGGGKGIRKVTSVEEVRQSFFAVTEEVRNSPVFCMRMLENVRHLEVQLLADEYGACIAVRTRDCSVQRRHQKIIEEGPVFGVDQKIINEMEAAAIRLAKAVGYVGLGTVEYMYNKETHTFCFLELNPRIQVEHPVSELISNVNLPAALLCVGMGIPLHRIPEVRSFFGEDPYGATKIDFDARTALPPTCHAIAVRVTAEDVEAGFRPTTGSIGEISFRNNQCCWGYFSVPSNGGVHQFADSQFGHIFATGKTREEARRQMVLALKSTVIRGEIRTSHAYVCELLETTEFRECDVSTAWLDRLIMSRKQPHQLKSVSIYPSLCAAAVHKMRNYVAKNGRDYISFLRGGHAPSTELLSNIRSDVFVHEGVKYTVSATLVSPGVFALRLGNSTIVVRVRECGYGIQLTHGGGTVVAYPHDEPDGLRIVIDGKSTVFTGDLDPTKLRSSVSGRLVRFVVDDGGYVVEGKPYVEVEVMKMILPLSSTLSGRVRLLAAPGSTLVAGKLLAEVEPEDPSRIVRAQDSTSPWPDAMRKKTGAVADGLARVSAAIDQLWHLMQGYQASEATIEAAVNHAMEGLASLHGVDLRVVASSRPFLKGPASNTYPSKVAAVVETLASHFVQTELHFDGKTREVALNALREADVEAETIKAFDFAHHHKHRQQVLCAVLNFVEQHRDILIACRPILENICTLKSPKSYGPVLIRARYLLRQCDMKSFDERKAELCKSLAVGDMDSLLQGSYGLDLMTSVLFDREKNLQQDSLKLFVRRAFFGVATVGSLDAWLERGVWCGRFPFESIEEANSPSNDQPARGAGFVALYKDDAEMAKHFDVVCAPLSEEKSDSVAFVFFSVLAETTQDEMSRKARHVLEVNKQDLSASTLKKITFLVHGAHNGPHIFTFVHKDSNFLEETLHRNLLPTTASRLELNRLTENYTISAFPTPVRQVHIFTASPKRTKAAAVETRLFVRMFVSPRDLGVSPNSSVTPDITGEILGRCIAAVELARSDRKLSTTVHNHLFVNFIELTFDVGTMFDTFKGLEETYAKRLFALGFREVEIKFSVATSDGPTSFRVFIQNPTGHMTFMRSYVEMSNGSTTTLRRAQYRDDMVDIPTVWESREALDALADSPKGRNPSDRRFSEIRAMLPQRANSLGHTDPAASIDREIPLAAYPPMSERQVKRLSAQVMGTTYAHDWILLFEVILKKSWKSLVDAHKLPRATAPECPLTAQQMTLVNGIFQKGDQQGDVGIIAWIVSYVPPAYYDIKTQKSELRKIVVVANDITVNSGSFAVPEDNLFKAASDYARANGLPFVYLSANSGARLGLINEVKKVFKVATTKDSIDYLFLTPEDYDTLKARQIDVNCEKVECDGETRFRIVDIVGGPADYIGVENLQGSALIAGHMSLNYATIPTISVVSGRSVGIGAYLVRLGKRVIQARGAPIILTGNVALNRLLGKDVYSDNTQLGGHAIMCPNGVTHWDATDDLHAVRTLFDWLDFVPSVTQPLAFVRKTLMPTIPDPVDRDVTFMPVQGEPYDPRFLVTGDASTTGMFDSGSWRESLAHWAKSVVTGRATLGGTPCGVILVETRTSKRFNPADPADPESVASIALQAGQVWFPDSARKTADALEDFHKESLPCFIIANWRGFSGGMRDMFDQVLKFGASIVDNLRQYTRPVFIYIPPLGELRGGAWVVVDPVINHCGSVEMYCDPSARGGILEPAGVVEIKFREEEVRQLIRRLNPGIAALPEADRRVKEDALLPLFTDVATRFADLHDTPGRMKAKKCIVDIIPWKNSRRVFHTKLVRKMKELEVVHASVASGESRTLEDAKNLLEKKFESAHEKGTFHTDDAATIKFLNSIKSEAPTHGSSAQLLTELLANGDLLKTVLSTNPQLREAIQSALK